MHQSDIAHIQHHIEYHQNSIILDYDCFRNDSKSNNFIFL